MTFQSAQPIRRDIVDQLIFREGEDVELAYVIENGEVEIFTDHNGVETVHERLGPGEIIAEMALIEPTPHSASARAKGKVTLRAVTECRLDGLRDELMPRSWAIVSLLVMRNHATAGLLRHPLVTDDTAGLEVAA